MTAASITPGRRRRDALWWFIPLSVFALVWIPDVLHYAITPSRISDELVVESRSTPSAAVLEELGNMNLGAYSAMRDRQKLIETADAYLRGQLELHPFPKRNFDVAFTPDDLDHPAARLAFASFIVPDVLLDAFRATADERYYLGAKRFLLAFANFESGRWRPKGMIWNDHAIASRVPVILKFWNIYRTRADFDSVEAAKILRFLVRSGKFLAKPSHYTFRTNHGVIQNVALLQICLGLPALPQAADWCDLGIGRFNDQLGFYINEEGVVLEHSAGYHAFGVELTGIILRALTLASRPIPKEWREKYDKAKMYYAAIRRPDGTLPMYGDTQSTPTDLLVTSQAVDRGYPPLHQGTEWRPPSAYAVYPVAGNITWWRGMDVWPRSDGLSHTVLHWGTFPSRAHKLADDMSVIFWRDGLTWVTNAGYWPSGIWGRNLAEGWSGSNAPHLTNESTRSDRMTDLVAYADDPELAVADLRRLGPGGYSARRQVLQLGTGAWLVVDETTDSAPRRTRTLWTLDPQFQIEPKAESGAFHLYAPRSGSRLSVQFLLPANGSLTHRRGSRDPFAGWVTIDGIPQAASAFDIDHPSNGWAISLWAPRSKEAAGATIAPLELIAWKNAEHWMLKVPDVQGHTTVERSGNEFLVHSTQRPQPRRITLAEPPNVTPARAEIAAAYERVAAESEKFREVTSYRWKVTYVLLVALAATACMLLLLRRLWPGAIVKGRLGLGILWLVGGAAIHLYYFG